MSKSLTVADEVRGTLQKMEPQFKLALPNHIPVEKFVRVLQTAVNNSPNLIKANRQSLLAAAMKAAQDGLLPDGKEAALVTFSDSVSYMPMTQGILKKVRNSGELASISPNVVYENDFFDYWIDETGEHLKHKPKLNGDRGEITHVYAIAITKDKAVYIEVMSKEEIEQVRSVSRSKNAGPWSQWYGEMARKTVMRRLSKRLPMSTDLDHTIHADDDIFMPPPEAEAQAAEPKPKKKTSSRLKQAIEKDVSPEPQDEAPQDVEMTQEEDADESNLPI